MILGDFNARVGKYQNMEILEENIVDPCLLCDSKGLYSDGLWKNSYEYAWLHKLDCLECINVFPLTNVLACLPAWGARSVVDYVFMKGCNLSMVNSYKIGALSSVSNHKPLYLAM